jgi:hypothetical protein
LVARARLTDESLDLDTLLVFLRSGRRVAGVLARAECRPDFFLLEGFKEPLCPAKRLEADFPKPY